MYRYFALRHWKLLRLLIFFLDLAIESWEVILSLGVLNADVESSFGLDSDAFEREEVERTGEGGGRSVCCAVDEGTVFAVFRRIVDA